MKQLPKELWKYFWDTKAEVVDIDTYPKYVGERVLEWGRAKDVRWLIGQYGIPTLKEIVKSSRQLSARQATFYAKIWDIPETEVLCLQPEFRRLHRQFWPY